VFRQETDTGIFPIQTWGDFEQQFRIHFFPVNAEADAINALEGASYHQGGRTVDDYLDNFQALVSDVSQTSFGHIFTNSSTIPTVSKRA